MIATRSSNVINPDSEQAFKTERTRLIDEDLQEAQQIKLRLSYDYITRCEMALENFQNNLTAAHEMDPADLYSIQAHADVLLQAGRVLFDDYKTNTAMSYLDMKQLAENIELIDDTLHAASTPNVDIERVQALYHRIEESANTIEGSTATKRAFANSMIVVGGLLFSAASVGIVIGYAIMIPTCTLSLALILACGVAATVGGVITSLACEERKKHLTTGIPQQMLLFGDSVNNKISNNHGNVPWHEQLRRSFR